MIANVCHYVPPATGTPAHYVCAAFSAHEDMIVLAIVLGILGLVGVALAFIGHRHYRSDR